MHDAVGETDTTLIQFVFSEKLRTGQQQFILKKSTEGTNLSTKPTTPYSEIQVQLKVDGEWLIEDDDMTEVHLDNQMLDDLAIDPDLLRDVKGQRKRLVGKL